jgi:hypothetical protein
MYVTGRAPCGVGGPTTGSVKTWQAGQHGARRRWQRGWCACGGSTRSVAARVPRIRDRKRMGFLWNGCKGKTGSACHRFLLTQGRWSGPCYDIIREKPDIEFSFRRSRFPIFPISSFSRTPTITQTDKKGTHAEELPSHSQSTR